MDKRKSCKKIIILISIIASACLIILGIILGVTLSFDSDGLFEIYSLAITVDDNIVNKINKNFTDDNFLLEFRVNDEPVDFDKQKSIFYEWTIVTSNTLGCAIDDNGLFSIGNCLGDVSVNLKVKSKNTFETSVNIEITLPEDVVFQDIEIVNNQDNLEFIEGQCFAPDAIKIYFYYEDIDKALLVPGFAYKNEPLSLLDTELELGINYVGVEQIISVPIAVKPKTLQRIEITKLPDKISYIEGQCLDLTGLEVTSYYEFISEIVTDYYIENVDGKLTRNQRSFTVSYIVGDIVKTDEADIYVEARELQSIEIISLPMKTRYTQGQTFNPDGMKVMAHFEYIDYDVTELIFWDKSGMLVATDEEVTIFYQENDVIKSQSISISVDLPYSSVRKVVFENPYDATLSWIYSYSNDGESLCIDNTQIDGHSNLLIDSQNGVYIVPVGAVITVMRVSPAVTGFTFQDKDWDLIFPTNSISFELNYGESELKINFKRVIGDRITIRFSSDPNSGNWAFIYPLNYNGSLKSSDLNRIAAIYEDTELINYEYAIGQNKYSFADLCKYNFCEDTFVIVSRVNHVINNAVAINVMYPNNIMFRLYVDKDDEFAFDKLPRVEKTGYKLKFASTQSGSTLDEKTFKEWLVSTENIGVVYANYELNVNIIDGEIVGTWSYAHQTEEREFSVTVNFYSNGTYDYKTFIDGTLNCKFEGIYTYDNEEIKIESLEYEGVNQLIDVSDFVASFTNGQLNVSLIIIEELSVLTGEISLEKVV